MTTKTNSTRKDNPVAHEASASLEKLALPLTTPDTQRTIEDGLRKHGDAFAAFMLGTPALELNTDELLETFDASSVLTAADQVSAEMGLAVFLGQVDGYNACLRLKKGEKVIDISLLNSFEVLRERIDESFDIVQFLSSCFVFDVRVIQDKLTR